MLNKNLYWLGLLFIIPITSHAADNHMTEDKQHVLSWNAFAKDLYRLHQVSLSRVESRTEQETGGYPGMRAFFEETKYYDEKSGKLLSRIQRETDKNNNIHMIEVFLYDKQGRVRVDYLAAFLPEFRNAPVQTLINIHHYNDRLHSFRQFDASGALIYEQCRGSLFGEEVFISLDEDEIIDRHNILKTDTENEQYFSCFESMPKSAKNYLKPMQQVDTGLKFKKDSALYELITKIESEPDNASLYIKRGDYYFSQHEFKKAVADYSTAIKLNNKLDKAYFGRGMALGRQGLIQQGIDDLSVYIKRNPYHSRAYTKRGVRYIWLGDTARAKQDMIKAVSLQNSNAEAHDDLGVIYASENNYKKAIYHFKQSIYYDGSYQKAYHNLAMAYLVTDLYPQALVNINKGLQLEKENRNSLLLKSSILEKLGKNAEAKKIKEYAEFLPEGNWSERFSLK